MPAFRNKGNTGTSEIYSAERCKCIDWPRTRVARSLSCPEEACRVDVPFPFPKDPSTQHSIYIVHPGKDFLLTLTYLATIVPTVWVSKVVDF